jgi:hypothetical protein
VATPGNDERDIIFAAFDFTMRLSDLGSILLEGEGEEDQELRPSLNRADSCQRVSAVCNECNE